ncbi:ATP-dependent DNA helicase [Corynebacterium mendelii]|uniref:ATP-dependent helicase DinG n=1 Tax=Corynebacterium mendelii TaxID=2765362 RepID=A0A939DZX9_9CORY|nr:ATP-dependent DNA helicase [Corynebacterium mendelii]MBN9644128.1 ATP-dependent DNA helicase [Corynebacterium mendelii]
MTHTPDDGPEPASTRQLLDCAVAAVGGAPRTGQQTMADEVTRAIESGTHLAVQAGTGTGKSLAYLVPAIRQAMITGDTVVVSTATIALQRQLVERDLPRLADALEKLLPRRPSFAMLKGRSNYLCRNKIAADDTGRDGLLDPAELTETGRMVKKIVDWAATTDTGDRDSFTDGCPDVVWRSVSVSSRECIGAGSCPFGPDCFAEAAKDRARDVDVLVTNHALLAIDAINGGMILPEHSTVIIDEAHELDGRITSVASHEISPKALVMAANRGKKIGAGAAAAALESAAGDFADWLSSTDDGRITDLDESGHAAINSIAEALRDMRREISGAAGDSPSPEETTEKKLLANHLTDLALACQRLFDCVLHDEPAGHNDVVWVEKQQRPGNRLVIAPLQVSDLLAEHLFPSATVIMTSATLITGGNFRGFATSVGLSPDEFTGIDVGSPFDPARSGILYVARHLPTPSRGEVDDRVYDEMEQLIMAAGGRTLGLFASRRAADTAAEVLSGRIPFTIFKQGDSSTGVLVDKFANDENSCLFGTLSLWQGVDVPGSACSLVIIDKIPFPRPDDPLFSARKQAADAAGRNGFMEVAAGHAALLLAQGAGRLLRSVTDKGVVAVLDNRLVTKRYGSFLLKSMPPMWTTTDTATVTGCLHRLTGTGSPAAESPPG